MLKLLKNLFRRSPPPPALAVAQAVSGPRVAVLLSRADEREAFRTALKQEGLLVTAPDPQAGLSWPEFSELGHPDLVVLDSLPYFEELRWTLKDVILITDGELEPGPQEARVFVRHRPIDLANPLEK